MKKIFTLVSAIIFFNVSQAQINWNYVADYVSDSNFVCTSTRKITQGNYYNDTLTAYFNFFWSPATPESAVFSTTAIKEGNLWHCYDYYIKNHSLLREGYFKDKELKNPEGEYKWYFPDQFVFRRGAYKNGKKEGEYLEYSYSHTLIDSFNYKNGIPCGSGFSYNIKDSIRTIYEMLNDGSGNGYCYIQINDGKKLLRGKFVTNYEKDSVWTYFRKDGKKWNETLFKNNDTVYTKCFDTLGKLIDDCETRTAKLGEDKYAISKFISSNISYPATMIENGIQGTVAVLFIIDTAGKMQDIQTLYSPDPEFTKEVKRVLSLMPDWIPGKQYGQLIRMVYQLPVKFQLQE